MIYVYVRHNSEVGDTYLGFDAEKIQVHKHIGVLIPNSLGGT